VIFTIDEDDWERLMEASLTARTTPVILVGGVDAAAVAHERVQRIWDDLALKYGFVVGTVRSHDEKNRQIKAEPRVVRPT
jgi:hypothetical protein